MKEVFTIQFLRKVIPLIAVILCPLSFHAQIEGCTDTTANNYDPTAELDNGLCTYGPLLGVEYDLVYEDDGSVPGYPAGFKTWRIYAVMHGSNDAIVKIFTTTNHPLLIGGSECAIWNHQMGGSLGSEIDATLLSLNPSLNFDSWLTIGISDNSDPGLISGSIELDPALNTEGIVSNLFISGINNAVNGSGGYSNVYPDEDGKILLGQFTCLGSIQFQINLLALDEGIESQEWSYVHSEPINMEFSGEGYNLSEPFQYCNDVDACNYSACPLNSLLDNNSCDYTSCYGCTDTTANNFNSEATIDDGSCLFGPLDHVFHELYYEDDGTVQGYPDGFKTWRIYAKMHEFDDYLFVLSPNSVFDADILVGSTTCEIWNHELGAIDGDDIDLSLYDDFPSLAYDSWLTINMEGPADSSGVSCSGSAAEAFTDSFLTPGIRPNYHEPHNQCTPTDGSANYDALNGFPDENGNVLIAQITTSGEPMYHLAFLMCENAPDLGCESFEFYHYNPESGSYSDESYGLSYPTSYCTNPAATNYTPCAHPEYVDNSICVIPGCMDTTANNFSSEATEDDGTCTYGPLIKVRHEVFYEDDGSIPGYPEGAKTYRVYADLAGPDHFLSAVFANQQNHLWIGSCPGPFWNHGLGATNGGLLSGVLIETNPELAFDSFVTIGLDNSLAPGNPAIIGNSELEFFQQHFGTSSTWSETLTIDDGIWGAQVPAVNGYGQGDAYSVLLAQITTLDEVQYHLNLQVFEDGDDSMIWQYFHSPDGQLPNSGPGYQLNYPTSYCNDTSACNYCPTYHPELVDNTICDYSCYGCMDELAVNFDSAATLDDPDSCVYFPCNEEVIILHMYDSGSNGWEGGHYEIHSFPDVPVASGTLLSGNYYTDTLCIANACHRILVDGGDNPGEISWQMTNLQGELLLDEVASPIAEFLYLGGLCPPFGCTNVAAPNFNSQALWDDYSCDLDTVGCLDSAAANYDPDATIEDNSCVYGEIGCTDPFAANYWPAAVFDPGEECVWGEYNVRVDDDYLALTNYPGHKRHITIHVESPNPNDIVSSVGANPATAPISIEVQNEGSIWNHTEGGVSASEIDPDQFGIFPDLEFDSRVSLGDQIGASNITYDPVEGLINSFDFTPGENLNMVDGSWSSNPPYTSGLVGTEGVSLLSITADDGVCGSLNFNLFANGSFIHEVSFHEVPFCSWPYDGCQNPSAANYFEQAELEVEECVFGEYTVLVEQIYSDDGGIAGYPSGFSTYRIYATSENPDDILDAVFSEPIISPIEISTSGQFWNHPGTGALGNQIPDGTTVNDLIYYDSYWTLGMENSADPGNMVLNDQLPIALFESGNLAGATIPKMELTKENCDDVNGISGELQRVLIAQVTTNGTLSGKINARWLIGGDCSAVAHMYELEFSGIPVEGCTDPIAINYNPLATIDNGSCEYEDCVLDEKNIEWACQDDQQGFILSSENNGFCFGGELIFERIDIVEAPIIVDLAENLALLESGQSYFVPLDLEECTDYDVTLNIDELQSAFPPITAYGCSSIYGCDDPYASNYVPDVTCNGPCEYNDCAAISISGQWHCEYDAETEEETSGLFLTANFVGPCNVDSICISVESVQFETCLDLDELGLEILDGVETFVPLDVPFEDEFEIELLVTIGAFSEILDMPLFPCIAGCMDSTALNFDENATISGEECEYPCDFNLVDITISPGVDYFEVSWALTNETGAEIIIGDGPYESEEDSTYQVCIPNECYRIVMIDSFGDGWDGAEYEVSIGESVIQTGDLINGFESFDFLPIDTTCFWIDGCTDIQALNYSPLANLEDGSCHYAGIDPVETAEETQETAGGFTEGNEIIFTIESEEALSKIYLTLITAFGQIAETRQISSDDLGGDVKVLFDFSHLAAGWYYLHVVHANKAEVMWIGHNVGN